ncbi:MAG: heavy metal sensor histidine kinase [Geobacteraceae bacterium]|nr:heavy metal sensor histidine kinase [Geobacteraceae bacterium]NTW79970.1 heavy metal sensor histidine kinase [Geobacteraceae bacterium]
MCSMNLSKSIASTSITARLTLLYLLSTLVILLCINGFLLMTLIDDLELEDNDFLSERIYNVQSIIARHPDSAEALRDHVLSDPSSQQTRYLVRIQDSQGRTILESPGMSSAPSLFFPPPVLSGNKIGRGIRYQGTDSRHYLLNAAWAEGSGEENFRLLQVALDVTDELALMRKYRLKMAVSLFIGLCTAGGIGVLITRNGLKPLNKMAVTVEQISSTGLHQRVGNGVWPKELNQLAVALDAMLTRLEESFNRLSDFSANLAHELRTPINNLRGEAEVALIRTRSADEFRSVVESSIEEYQRLSRMITDILFLARPELGIEKQPLNVETEIEILIEYFHDVAEERDIKIDLSGSGTALADPRLFQRAVGNIISNALHYTQNGGRISIAISTLPDHSLAIDIQDSGLGIAPEELPKVFDRFYRSASARHLHNQGSGLGLAIVRSIMELHSGTVSLTSEPGKGTLVTLRFPQQ